jgi:hypothetical protein
MVTCVKKMPRPRCPGQGWSSLRCGGGVLAGLRSACKWRRRWKEWMGTKYTVVFTGDACDVDVKFDYGRIMMIMVCSSLLSRLPSFTKQVFNWEPKLTYCFVVPAGIILSVGPPRWAGSYDLYFSSSMMFFRTSLDRLITPWLIYKRVHVACAAFQAQVLMGWENLLWWSFPFNGNVSFLTILGSEHRGSSCSAKSSDSDFGVNIVTSVWALARLLAWSS